jgi:hypothetical protein
MSHDVLFALIAFVVFFLCAWSLWRYSHQVNKACKIQETADRQLLQQQEIIDRQERILDRIERLVTSFEERQRSPDDRFRSS